MSSPPTTVRRLLICTLVAALVAAPAMAAPAAATTAEEPTGSATATASVSVSPDTVNVTVGETTTVDIVVDAPNGLDGYRMNVTLGNGTVADITDVTLYGNPTFPETSWGPNNDSVAVGGAGTSFSSSAPTVVTLELSGDVSGQTTVSLGDIQLQDADGNNYSLGTVTDGQFTVASPDSTVTVTDLADLGSVESGTQASVSATVANTGNNAVDTTVDFAVDGSTADTRTVSLAVDERRDFTFSVDTSSLSTGTHSYTLTTQDDSATRQFDVTEPTSSTVSVGLEPTDATVSAGGSTTFDVVATVPNGLQGATLSFGLTDTATANITAASADSSAALSDAEIGPSNGTLDFEVGYLDDQDAATGLTLGTVTATGATDGQTTLEVTSATLKNTSAEYSVDQYRDATLTVSAFQSTANLSFTPANASVATDGSTTFDVVVTADEGFQGANLTVSIANDTAATIAGVTPNQSAAFSSATVAADNGSANIEAGFVSEQDASGGLAIGTVAVAGGTVGETNLTVTDATVTSDAGQYRTAATDATLSVTAAQPRVNVTFTPPNATVFAGGSTTVDVVATANGGLQGANLTVSIANDTTATIADATPNQSAAFSSATVAADNGSANIEAGFVSEQDASGGLVVGTVTVAGGAVGETTLSVADARIRSDSGAYQVVSTDANVTVEPASVVVVGSNPAGNLDGDAPLEDVDGDGQGTLFDAIAYYNARQNDAITDNPDLFDFDGDGRAGSLFDAIALYNDVSG